jgi:hypothetical protein
MRANVLLTAIAFSLLAIPTLGQAQTSRSGTPEEARAMLDRVVAGMKADPTKTIAQIKKGEGGFKDRDLYAFCAGPKGRTVAHPDPTQIGVLLRENKDVNGKPFGAEFARVAQEGKVAEVEYMYPRPGPNKTPVHKVSFVTKVRGHVCGVGFYR